MVGISKSEINKQKRDRGGVLHFASSQGFDSVLPLLNISAVSLANNHILDCNKAGFEKTINKLDAIGIKYTGAGYEHRNLEPVTLSLIHI